MQKDGTNIPLRHVTHLWSAVECGARDPLCYHFKIWASLFSPRCPSSLSCINEYLAKDDGGHVSEQFSRVLAVWLECFQEKPSWCQNEQVCLGVKCEAL